MPLSFKSQAEVVEYLRESSDGCRSLSESVRGRGSVLDAQYLAGRADAFSLAAALIESLPSFKGEKTGGLAPVKEEKKRSSRLALAPDVDEKRRAAGAEATLKTRGIIQSALDEGDPFGF